MRRDSVRGQLLVALPALSDPNFDRTIVYVVEHNDEGAFGLVINRPTSDGASGPIEAWDDLLVAPATVFEGGPVQPDGFIGLAEVDGPDAEGAWATLDGGLGTVDLTVDPAVLAGRLGRLRIFRGYSGWGPGQLDGELAAEAWLVVDAVRDDVYSHEPVDLWRRVLRRQPGRTAWLANYPSDLADN